MDWLTDYWASLTLTKALSIIGAMVLSFCLSSLLVAFVLVNIPKDFFRGEHQYRIFSDSHPILRWMAILIKNVLGIFLIALGIVLSIPGVPGQGLLTILIGLILTDVPGKRGLEIRLLRLPTVLASVNKLRGRFNKAPLQLDQ